MNSERLKAIVTKVECAMFELIAECAYLGEMCGDQTAEIKQLRFEASGARDLRKEPVRDQLAMLENPMHGLEPNLRDPCARGHDFVRRSDCNEACDVFVRRSDCNEACEGNYFDVVIWRWIAIIDVPIGRQRL